MRKLRGKSAVVTGAASGIGRAIALRLAQEGVHLYLLDIDDAAMAEVVEEASRRRVDVVGRRCDLTCTKQISGATDDLLHRWDGADILINNAGIAYYGQTAEMSAENWQRLLSVNLLAPIQLTRELLPSLLQREEAHILNVASVCGLIGLGRVAAYTTSKFGLVGFSESLRAEYARRGLGVTALCPGFVDTNLFATAPFGPERESTKLPPRKLLAQPDYVAGRAVRAIRRNEALAVVQPYARALYYAKRLFPGVLDIAHRFSRRRTKTATSHGCSQPPTRRAA